MNRLSFFLIFLKISTTNSKKTVAYYLELVFSNDNSELNRKALCKCNHLSHTSLDTNDIFILRQFMEMRANKVQFIKAHVQLLSGADILQISSMYEYFC